MLADIFGPDLLIVAIVSGRAPLRRCRHPQAGAQPRLGQEPIREGHGRGQEGGRRSTATAAAATAGAAPAPPPVLPPSTRRRLRPRRERRAPDAAGRTRPATAAVAIRTGGPCHLTSSPSPTASGTASCRRPPSTPSTTSAASSRSPTASASAPPSPTSRRSPPRTACVLVDTGSAPLAKVVHDDIRTWSPARLNTAVYSHGHIDHVFGVPVWEAEAADAGLGRPRGHRPPRAARPLRPLHLHRRLQHHHQPPAVRLHRPQLADRVPLPGPDLPRHAGALGRRPRLLAAPREGRDRRPHRHLAARHPGPVLRRPLHLGLAQRRQSPEGAALPAGVGGRPAPHAAAGRRVPPARPRLPGHRSRPGPHRPHRHGGPPRLPGRPDPGRHERRAGGSTTPSTPCASPPPWRPGPSSNPSTTSPSSSSTPCGASTAAGGTATPPPCKPAPERALAPSWPRWPAGRAPWPTGPSSSWPWPASDVRRRWRPKGRCAWPATWPSTPGWPTRRRGRAAGAPAGLRRPGRPGHLHHGAGRLHLGRQRVGGTAPRHPH